MGHSQRGHSNEPLNKLGEGKHWADRTLQYPAGSWESLWIFYPQQEHSSTSSGVAPSLMQPLSSSNPLLPRLRLHPGGRLPTQQPCPVPRQASRDLLAPRFIQHTGSLRAWGYLAQGAAEAEVVKIPSSWFSLDTIGSAGIAAVVQWWETGKQNIPQKFSSLK